MEPMHQIRIATACFVNDHNELLVVRKRNTTRWMLPGGKLDGDESAVEAVRRELKEELQLDVPAAALTPLGRFEEMAANEPDTRVRAEVFVAQVPEGQVPRPAAEIAEMQWLPMQPPAPPGVAPLLAGHILPALRRRRGEAG